jgi:hypothetical protein
VCWIGSGLSGSRPGNTEFGGRARCCADGFHEISMGKV